MIRSRAIPRSRRVPLRARAVFRVRLPAPTAIDRFRRVPPAVPFRVPRSVRGGRTPVRERFLCPHWFRRTRYRSVSFRSYQRLSIPLASVRRTRPFRRSPVRSSFRRRYCRRRSVIRSIFRASIPTRGTVDRAVPNRRRSKTLTANTAPCRPPSGSRSRRCFHARACRTSRRWRRSWRAQGVPDRTARSIVGLGSTAFSEVPVSVSVRDDSSSVSGEAYS